MSSLAARLYDDLVAITASDTVKDPAGPFVSLLVTGTGTLKITTVGNEAGSVTLAGVAVGEVIETPVQRVWVTGTSATVAGYRGISSGGMFK